ncbi:MAG: EAL domain-containing protein [Rhodospirillales bacterium]|nr:EAL domain-containing protein [Rhodospirillales bacterium]
MALVLAVLSATSARFAIFERIDAGLHDWLVPLSFRPAPPDIIIIAIDAFSLDALGRWPWSRRRHAELIDILTRAHARVIGLDLLLIGADNADPQGDLSLIEAMRRSGRVVLPVAFDQIRADGFPTEVLPDAAFVDAAAMLGHVDVVTDADGITRSVFLKAGVSVPVWPAFPLAMLRVAQPQDYPSPQAQRNANGEGAFRLLWTRDREILVPFAGPPGHFRQVSYVDVLEGRVNPAMFQNSLVLIGVTAATLSNTFSVPPSVGEEPISGVEFNAMVLDALRAGIIHRRLEPDLGAAITAVAVLSAAAFFLFRKAALSVFLLFAVSILGFALLLVVLIGAWFGPTAALSGLVLAFLLRLTLHVRAQSATLAAERERTRATWDSLGEGIIVASPSGTIDFMNAAAARLIGRTFEHARGRPMFDMVDLRDEVSDGSIERRDLFDTCSEEENRRSARDFVLHRPDGQTRLVRVSIARLRNPNGAQKGTVLALSDVTLVRRLGRAIEYKTTHDSVTGLPNRRQMESILAGLLGASGDGTTSVGVLIVDVDDFDIVNQRLGYTGGDAVLQSLGERLRRLANDGATLGRLAADEFVLVVADVAREDWLGFLAHRMRKSIEASVTVAGFSLQLTASIGVSVFPRDGGTVDALLNQAGLAARRAKDRGGNAVCFATEAGNVEVLSRSKQYIALAKALQDDRLTLHYQPQVRISTGRTVAMEALLRWPMDDGRTLTPADFLGVAEDGGLWPQISDWVVRRGLAQLAEWRRSAAERCRLSVNIPAGVIACPAFRETLAGSVRNAGLHPRDLVIEVSEAPLIRDIDQFSEPIRALAAMGIVVVVDNVGVGMSSLLHLGALPIYGLKLDRTNVADAFTDTGDAAMLAAVLALAKSMNLHTAAVGVETARQLDVLGSFGCEDAQGYLFGQPMSSAETMRKLLKQVSDGQR